MNMPLKRDQKIHRGFFLSIFFAIFRLKSSHLRRKPMAIEFQVSRSIGDLYLKKPELCKHPVFRQFVGSVPLSKPVMSAEPSIHVRRINLHDSFVIFASDGLWEQLSDQTAVEIVFKNPRSVSSDHSYILSVNLTFCPKSGCRG